MIGSKEEKIGRKRQQRQLTLLETVQDESGENAEVLDKVEEQEGDDQKMKLVERIQVKKTPELSALCHHAKNLYNRANYLIKEQLKGSSHWVRYNELYGLLKGEQCYKDLPAQTSQQVLKLIDKNWKSYFEAHKDWKVNPEKYQEEPQPPKYKPKSGESIAIFTNQQCRLQNGYLLFPKRSNLAPIKVNSARVPTFQQVRILPRGIYYIVELVYETECTVVPTDEGRIVAIDLGLRNLVCVVNNFGVRPWIVKGGAVKSINQFYNKMLAKYSSIKDRQGIKGITTRLHRFTRTRNNKINDFFHQLSRAILNYCVNYQAGTIVLGYNPLWKHKCNMGKKNNQNFVNIPFQRLVNQIKYKADLVGIRVVLVEESHTSKCSFVDAEPIEHHETYVGRRVQRGLFKSATGRIINADVNGAYNILRKAFPKAIAADGIVGLGFVPYSVPYTELNNCANLNPAQTNAVLKALPADGIALSRQTETTGSDDEII